MYLQPHLPQKFMFWLPEKEYKVFKMENPPTPPEKDLLSLAVSLDQDMAIEATFSECYALLFGSNVPTEYG